MVTYRSLSFTKLFSSGSSSSLVKKLLYSDGFTVNCRGWSVDLWHLRCSIKSSTAETGDWGLDVDGNSLVAGGVKGNRICLSGGVPSADSGTVGVESENLFSSFIARPVMSFVVVLHYRCGNSDYRTDAVSTATLSPVKRYHGGPATATRLATDYVSEITS